MLSSFAEDENNDFYLDDFGNLAIAQDVRAVLFLCEAAAETLQSELVLNTDIGLPNFQTVWNGAPNLPQYEGILRDTFLKIEGVEEVTQIIVSLKDNILNYNAVIQTRYGSGVLNNG